MTWSMDTSQVSTMALLNRVGQGKFPKGHGGIMLHVLADKISSAILGRLNH